MCTLTFYPKPKNEGFILTFSRDEMPERSSIVIEQDAEKGLVYPKDALHGGTWLAFSPQKQRFACLLNGAFEVHERTLPYRKSRGSVVLERFDYADITLFCTQYDFEGIEPCTMILWEKDILIELRWDGMKRHIKFLDPTTPHIYSSCTLYNKEVRKIREKWYSDFLKNSKPNTLRKESFGQYPIPDNLWTFHQTPNATTPENALLMYRPSGLCTVSISQLNFDFFTQTIDFKYHELGTRKTNQYKYYAAQPALIAGY